MTDVKLKEILCETLLKAQKKYREWLLAQPKEEILNHAYEYAVRKEVVERERTKVHRINAIDFVSGKEKLVLQRALALITIYTKKHKRFCIYIQIVTISIDICAHIWYNMVNEITVVICGAGLSPTP